MSASKRLVRLASRGTVCALTAMVLAACNTPARRTAAPVVEHTPSTVPAAQAPAAPEPAAPMAGGAPTYIVKRGDTLLRIATAHGVDWRDLQSWNGLADPNQISVGQELRLRPPGSAPVGTSVAPPPGTAQVAPIGPVTGTQPRPLDAPPGTGVNDSAPPPPPPPAATRPATPAAPVPRDGPDDRIDWGWPANGALIEGFNEQRNKGLDIGGNPGDPVLAAADGKVVYSGSGLRGYGNLIIIKHNNTYLSAYAHNRALLVKEGAEVKRGQRIAELGQTDAASPRVHFEIRRQGKPVDPAGFLPAR